MNDEMNEFEKFLEKIILEGEDYSPSERMEKEVFMEKFRDVIIEWIKRNEKLIVESRRKYSWKGRGSEKRDELEGEIYLSRQRHQGGIDLRTADRIYDWGFGRNFPLRDEEKVKKVTKEAFEFAESGDYYKAVKKLMEEIYGMGIAGASKILGLSNQEILCIYDSRVGNAFRELKKGDQRIILCPPDRSYKRSQDSTTKSGWAANYEKLIWTLEIMRDYLKEKSHNFRIADIEMALWKMGE